MSFIARTLSSSAATTTPGLFSSLLNKFRRPKAPETEVKAETGAQTLKPFKRERTKKIIYFAPVAPENPPPLEQTKSLAEALAASIAPTHNVTLAEDVSATELSDPHFKTQFLAECAGTFKREIASYQLNGVQSVGDVIHLYSQPWQSQIRLRDLPLFHQLQSNPLPQNLKIYH